jgi:hypothetical protein
MFCTSRHGTANKILMQVVRLLYTNSGSGLLALGSNAIQRLWKWNRNDQNPCGKVYNTFSVGLVFKLIRTMV